MTVALALEYIPRRMAELGFGKEYYIRFRHLVLQGNEILEIPAYNQYYILVDEADQVNVSSDFGLFDLSLSTTNEQIYEHQGLITIQNYSGSITHLRFIQVIPKHYACEKTKTELPCQ
jgi:hypothetical protein